jgi:hypothetical protein
MRPWEDTPLCPCGGPLVTTQVAHWNHRAGVAARLVCCACGEGRVGSDAEVERASKADAAWEAEKARESLMEGQPQ